MKTDPYIFCQNKQVHVWWDKNDNNFAYDPTKDGFDQLAKDGISRGWKGEYTFSSSVDFPAEYGIKGEVYIHTEIENAYKRNRVKYVCKKCGSSNVIRDAWAKWDVEQQEWALEDDEMLGNTFCRDCNGEATIIEVEI